MLKAKDTGIDSILLAAKRYDGNIRYKLDKNTEETGDNSYLWLWAVLMFISSGTLL